MKIMQYKYECETCRALYFRFCLKDERDNQICLKCNNKLSRFIGNLIPLGTRDSFGIKNSFIDDNSGKEIDNWKTWEKAGYRNPLHVTRNKNVKEKIKEKMDKKKKGV